MIFRLLNCQFIKRTPRKTTCSSAYRKSYGCKSISKLESGTPLGFDNRATISISLSLNHYET